MHGVDKIVILILLTDKIVAALSHMDTLKPSFNDNGKPDPKMDIGRPPVWADCEGRTLFKFKGIDIFVIPTLGLAKPYPSTSIFGK